MRGDCWRCWAEPVSTSPQELTVPSSHLHVQWRHVSSLKSAPMGVFTSWKSGNAPNLGCPLPNPPPPRDLVVKYLAARLRLLQSVKPECKPSSGAIWSQVCREPPAKAHSHVSHKALKSNQKTGERGGPLQKREMDKHLFSFSTNIRNKMRMQAQINSIALGCDSLSEIRPHPLPDQVVWILLKQMTSVLWIQHWVFSQWQLLKHDFLHHKNHWKPLPRMTP